MKDFSNEIRAYALRAAIEFGEADATRIMPKLFLYGLEKKDIKAVMPKISKITDEVNSMSKAEREKEFEEYKQYIKEREEKEKTLPELPNVKGKVVTRFPPEPSKFLHLGHALSLLINYMYAEKYKGEFLLRFEDANPEKVSQTYVDGIMDDVKNYLGINVDKATYVSDDMPKFYDYAQKLIKKGHAFMCFCDRDTMQELRHAGKECPCRKKSAGENEKAWNEFLDGKYAEGKAVLRLRGDMQNVNHVMRDPVIFRLVNKLHFRQGSKYKVWPMYDFYNPIEDSLMGVTHIMRSNEFDVRVELHEHLKKLLGLPTQTVMQYGRFNVIGAETKGRDIRERIESREYMGWDDPRLVTLKALRRRGITKEVLQEVVNHIGLSKNQISIDFDMIAAISRKLLDTKVKRYYFVAHPVQMHIHGMPDIKEVAAKLHPDKDETRSIPVGKSVWIAGEDAQKFKGKDIRLMNLATIHLGEQPKFITLDNKPVQKLQWVSEGAVPVRIMMDNGQWIEGLGEPALAKLKVGSIVQLERFGFVRLDGVKKQARGAVHEFWFAHQ